MVWWCLIYPYVFALSVGFFLLGPKHSLAEFNKAASASYTQLNDNEKLQLQHDSHNKQEIVWTESKARARANKIFRKIKQQVLNWI